MRGSDAFAAAGGGLVVLITGLAAGFVLFGVCDERSGSATCDAVVPGNTSHLVIGPTSAILVVGVGLIFHRRAVLPAVLTVIGIQALLAMFVGLAVN